MAKVKIQGHASGTGILTVTAPNTSTDRTITLPDATGTLATTADVPSSITDNGNATAITIDSRENVGIGVVPESDWYNGGVGSEYRMLQMGTAAVVGGYADNSTYLGSNWKDDAANKYINTDEASLYKQSAGVHKFMVAPSGSADAAMTLTTGFEVLNDGKARAKNGLLFGTDTAAANALDDYEEGTHNQVWTTGNSGSITMNRVAVSYIKIGRLVTIFGEVDVSTVSSPVGGCRVSLPFTIASHSAGRNATTMTRPGIYHVIHHQDNPPLFMIPAGSSVIEGVYEQDGGAFADYNPAAGDAIYFGFSYLTT
jgi:hypothetical protein